MGASLGAIVGASVGSCVGDTVRHPSLTAATVNTASTSVTRHCKLASTHETLISNRHGHVLPVTPEPDWHIGLVVCANAACSVEALHSGGTGVGLVDGVAVGCRVVCAVAWRMSACSPM